MQEIFRFGVCTDRGNLATDDNNDVLEMYVVLYAIIFSLAAYHSTGQKKRKNVSSPHTRRSSALFLNSRSSCQSRTTPTLNISTKL